MSKAELIHKGKVAALGCADIQKLCRKGLHTFTGRTCKVCQKEKHAEWIKNNHEIHKKIKRDWAAKNKEKIALINKKQREKDPLAVLSRKANYRELNKEKIALAGAKYRANNVEAIRLLKANRRAMKRNAGGSLSNGLVDKLMVLQRGRCACCGERLRNDYHLDHIIPIALGGANSDDNIQLLKSRCNLQKKAKHPVEFMQSRGFLL